MLHRRGKDGDGSFPEETGRLHTEGQCFPAPPLPGVQLRGIQVRSDHEPQS